MVITLWKNNKPRFIANLSDLNQRIMSKMLNSPKFKDVSKEVTSNVFSVTLFGPLNKEVRRTEIAENEFAFRQDID